jgi:hypothetical protein
VTRFGTIRLRIARAREKSFLPVGLRRFQRREEEVSLLIREAFLRGISTRQVGRVVATLTGETVSAQTVSKLTRDLDEAVRQFHRARLSDDYVYLFFDGVSLRVRRRAGRKQVQMLVAYGIRRDGNRHLLAFLRSQGESQADWEALLEDLYRRGLDAGRSRLSRLPLVPGLSHHGPAVAAGLARVAVILRLSPPPVAQLRTTNVIERSSSKCAAALGPWCALLMWRASTASSTPSSRDSTWNGKPAPSTYLHKQLDVAPVSPRLY